MRDPTPHMDNIPLFPLPGMVLFPGQDLPLRIFEPRYRAMTRDVLDGERRICMVHLQQKDRQPEPSSPPEAEPAFHAVGGLGRIIEHEQLGDGGYNLILRGEARVRVKERPCQAPYRRGDLTLLESETNFAPSRDETRALAATAERYVKAIRRTHPNAGFELPSAESPGALADACASYFVSDPTLRQALLEELTEQKRVSLCLEAMMQRLEPQGTSLN